MTPLPTSWFVDSRLFDQFKNPELDAGVRRLAERMGRMDCALRNIRLIAGGTALGEEILHQVRWGLGESLAPSTRA